MSTRRIAISSAWSSFMRQDEQSEALPGVGDQWTRFEALYQRYYPRVLGFLRFLVGTSEVAEDLTSQVFEKAWTHFADVRSPETAGPWLFRIARNCVVDYFRRSKPTVSLERLLPTEHPQADSIEEGAIAHEEQRHLLAHLSQLTDREREVIGLKFVAGLTNREIAGTLQIPEGTVSSLLYRTLRRLRVALAEEGGHDET